MKILYPFNYYLMKLLPLFFLVLLLTNCSGKRAATGLEDEIMVFADSSEYALLKDVLIKTFEKEIITPQLEKLFLINRKNIELLEKYKGRKNILFIAPMNSGSQVSGFLDKVFDDNVKKLVMTDSIYYVSKKDVWARNQMVLYVTAPSMEKLLQKLDRDENNLIEIFKNISDERLYKSLYNATYEKTDIEAKLMKNYGWIIYVQADYILAKDQPDNNFVWIRRAVNTDMERWIFVHWIDNASPDFLNKDSILARRNQLTEKFYRTSDNRNFILLSTDDYLTSKEVNFNNKYAIKTEGFWRFSDYSGGGPLVNYSFYDEKTHRIYMIDGSIYAPKYFKKKLIQQVDVTLKSFKTIEELTEDQIETLNDALE